MGGHPIVGGQGNTGCSLEPLKDPKGPSQCRPIRPGGKHTAPSADGSSSVKTLLLGFVETEHLPLGHQVPRGRDSTTDPRCCVTPAALQLTHRLPGHSLSAAAAPPVVTASRPPWLPQLPDEGPASVTRTDMAAVLLVLALPLVAIVPATDVRLQVLRRQLHRDPRRAPTAVTKPGTDHGHGHPAVPLRTAPDCTRSRGEGRHGPRLGLNHLT